MTDLLIRTLSRHPTRRLARPSAVFAFALALAYGGGFWQTLLHHLEGAHERNEPGLLAHWLRDATLALPLVAVAVWVGILVARRLIERHGAERSPALAGATLAAVVAWVQSTAVGLASPIHNGLFGGTHDGPESFYLVHAGRDAMLNLVVVLPLAALVSAALLRSRPWAAPLADAWRAPRGSRARLALQGGLAMVVIAPVAVMANATAITAVAGSGPGQPCPTSAPLKTFDVTAIDVDMTLNRFGDHDPLGKMYVLTKDIPKVRAAEASRHVSIGQHENDAIQPLVVRANLGDCVQIQFTNDASGGDFGIHIDGLAYDIDSSGDAIGDNPSSAVGRGDTRTYRFWIPRDEEAEGAHYIRPGAGNRAAVSHGLFGSLTAEPAGSEYFDMNTGQPVDSGWEAIVKPAGAPAFREFNLLHHEVGNEKYDIPTAAGGKLPQVDPHTEAYRPGSRGMNYRSEPFFNRLERQPKGDSHGYSTYAFGDPATPMPRGYQGDPTKIRVLHAGSEVFHVYHLHGGSIRWRLNPHADKTFDYGETGLDKAPKKVQSRSARLDSQAIGPGESYDLQIEGGAGGLQQGAGEFLFHCHIGKHYIGGMWSFWRVYDTLQPTLAPLPDRAPLPASVDSTQLIGKTMPDGTTLTADNLEQWIRPQLPPQGTRAYDQDASVWDYEVQQTASGPLFLGEPEEKEAWTDLPIRDADRHKLAGHPGLLPGDEPVGAQDRPKIRFNPANGRPAFPLLRTHVGQRPPFAPNGHSGAPYLGEKADQPKTTGAAPDPWAGRKDGICPAGARAVDFNLVALDVRTPVKATPGGVDDKGKVFVLAKDVDDVLAGRKPVEPLAIRANIGDCVNVILSSRLADANSWAGFSKVNMHIHHVQFDTQASDGVISGMSFEQSIRPYEAEDLALATAAAAGDTTLSLTGPPAGQEGRLSKLRKGVTIAVGLGTPKLELAEIASVDGTTVTLARPLTDAHAAGQYAGTEFARSIWYPDVELDNVFWHDHVDGIHTWGAGLVSQLIVEPRGSTYHDPKTGAQVDSGTFVDVRTPNASIPGLVDGSFREQVLWTIDGNTVTDSTLNLRAAPWAERGGDPSLLFSSYTHGDPNTPLPRAYAGDPFMFRTINVGPSMDTLSIDGHRFFTENRFQAPDGKPAATPTNAIAYGVSERYTLALDGGAGGPGKRAGDYLYFNGVGRRFKQGAWGILRVLPRKVDDLQPLPGNEPPAGAFTLPTQTGGRPVPAGGAGDPCPAGAPQRNLAISAVDVPGSVPGRTTAFVPSDKADAVKAGTVVPQPLAAHAAAGECVTVAFKNERAGARASFHVAELQRTPESSGVNVGFNPEQTVEPGGSRTYRLYADTRKIGAATISDFGASESGTDGLYGAMVVHPGGATFTDPETGSETSYGTAVDVHVPGSNGYRDFVALMADDDPVIGGDFMPYPTEVAGPAMLNYRSAPRPDGSTAFSNNIHGAPATPMFRAYGGDPTKVHFLVAPGSEQPHVASLGGQSWRSDPELAQSFNTSNQNITAYQALDAEIQGGAGGLMRSVGDFFYGDMRRPFTQAGIWGLMRVMSDPGCPIRPLDGLGCTAQPSIIVDPPPQARPGAPAPGEAPGTGSGPAPGGAAAGGAAAAPAAGGVRVGGVIRTGRRAFNVRVARRMALATLARRGLWLELITPANTRVVDAELLRARGKKLTRVARARLKTRRGGAIELRWRLKASELRGLRPGSYIVRVRAGRTARTLSRQRVEARLRLTGRVPKLGTGRRR